MADMSRVLTESQESLLRDVLNRIVPAEDDFPGAGDLGIASRVHEVVSESATLAKLFVSGLAQIEVVAAGDMGKDFRDLSPEEKDRVLRRVEQEQSDFFNALVQHTYNGYYTHPAIFPLIGYEGHPPQPLGYAMKPFDPALLENVRKRAPFFRQT